MRKSSVNHALWPAVLVMMSLLLAPSASAASAMGTVDPAIQYGKWEGWGTSLAWWGKVIGGFPPAIRQEYMDKIFSPTQGLGLNVIRYNIGGGENPQYLLPNHQFLSFRGAVAGYEPAPGQWDWSADANQRWVLTHAIGMGANQVEAFSNSPPWWMTNSGSVTGARGGTDNLNPRDNTAFADYLATVVQHFHDNWGVDFRDVEPLNEPSGTWWHFGGVQEGCHVDRPQQNLLIAALGAALAKKGIHDTTVAASDENNIGDADATLSYYSPASLKYLSKINTHTYGGGDRMVLFNYANSHHKDLWVSEHGDGDGSGMTMSREIITEFKDLHPTAWVYWQAVDGGGWGFLSNPENSETNTAYTINEKYFVMGQYCRYIRPGNVLVAVNDPNSVAAYDAATRRVVIVTTNDGNTPSLVTFNLSRFTHLGSEAAVIRTSPTQSLARLPDILLTKKIFTDTTPAKSVTTYVISGAAYDGSLGLNCHAFYRIISKRSHLALSVSKNPADLLQAVLSRSGQNTRQQWCLVGEGGRLYEIVNRRSGFVLDLNRGAKTPGAGVVQRSENGSESQLWRLERAGAGLFWLDNLSSGLRLSPSGSGIGAALVQQSPEKGDAQEWALSVVHRK